MKKYFGTDGIRGVANQDLTPELSFKLGRVLGTVFQKENEKVSILIGRDTRLSGEMLEMAIISGLLSSGANVMRLGVISTPGVAYLTKALSATCGIMISASHNPYYDNGIKIFGSDGYKLMDDVELQIEALIDQDDDLFRPINEGIGRVENFFEGMHKYLSFIQKSIPNTFEGLKIAVDCANGSTSNLAPQLFANLGADVLLLNNAPNGLNINVNSGSTHIATLQHFVRENDVHLGVAFDGDGDRIIVVDEKGNVIDGDGILFIMGKYLKNKQRLQKDLIVSTVMSNIGFYKALNKHGLTSVKTQVGDRYVLEEMLKNGYNLGGEQSGHIIFLDYATTGDGLLTAVQLINVLVETELPLSELAKDMVTYPQVLKNIRVKSKENIMKDERVLSKIRSVEEVLGEDGRVLVRPSGTEDLLRIMVEAQTDELANKYVDEIIAFVKATE